MAHLEDDFAAYTTIGDRVVPAAPTKRPAQAGPQGPKFGVPAKLEPYTLLAKSARGAGAANLVRQAVAAPGVYVFSELLELPSIDDLANHEQHAAHYRLLELFAYGTWADYTAKRESFPALKPEEETKLKHLTVLSLASECRVIPYATLLSTLDLPSVPALEDLLIEAIYANILTGRLDQKESRLQVVSSLGRDVRPSTSSPSPAGADAMQLDSSSAAPTSTSAPSIASLHASLTSWLDTISKVLSSLDQHIASLTAAALNSSARALAHEEKVKAMVVEVAKSAAGSKEGKAGWKETASTARSGIMGASGGGGGGATAAGGGGGGGGGDMDVDSPLAAGGTTRGAMSPSGAGGRTRKRGRNL
ncbi:hypothetical protein JCM21900_006779 [Sporobolomyces salmonicolor]